MTNRDHSHSSLLLEPQEPSTPDNLHRVLHSLLHSCQVKPPADCFRQQIVNSMVESKVEALGNGEETEEQPLLEGPNQEDPIMPLVYIAVWMFMSTSVVLFNKYLLSFANFGFPIALTTIHMGFSSLVCAALVHWKVLEVPTIPSEVFWRAVVPIGALFSLVLAAGNGAYMQMSVSLNQMIKASQPALVFLVGNALGTEQFSFLSMVNVMMIVVGVVIAAYGEVDFVFVGFMLQAFAVSAEALRITLVQLILQTKRVRLDPISTLYYVAPCCFLFLLGPLWCFEIGPLMQSSLDYATLIPLLILNAVAAFGLNLAVFLVVGKTSALTMNIAGVAKDWLLIALSVALFKSVVTRINLIGYGIAFVAVCWYNHRKRQNSASGTVVPNKDISEATASPSNAK